jgi:hypothetical protein
MTNILEAGAGRTENRERERFSPSIHSVSGFIIHQVITIVLLIMQIKILSGSKNFSR